MYLSNTFMIWISLQLQSGALRKRHRAHTARDARRDAADHRLRLLPAHDRAPVWVHVLVAIQVILLRSFNNLYISVSECAFDVILILKDPNLIFFL